MRISLNWLKDYLDIKPEIDIDQLCQTMTMAGLEVESLEQGEELLGDSVFSLGITPNRSDALSHLGVSRELAALLDLTTRAPMLSLKEMAGPIHEKVSIEIENSSDCPRYALRVLENVRIGESPEWIRKRLEACGVKPINNVVDISNFVMLDRGQPMHAFDYDALKKDGTRVKIIVRRAKMGEKLVILDGKEMSLSSDDLSICDVDGPLAIAGVVGGLHSAIKPSTTTVLLEAAYFEPTLIRKSARAHGISTDSSYRFERGIDPSGVVDALNYAARLLVENSEAKACREPIDAYRKRIDPLEIQMRPGRAQDILGISAEHFDQDLLRRKFLRLGIETVAKRGDAIYFRVPTFRPDLSREIDLIEEAVRMIGYDKISDSFIAKSKESQAFVDNKVCESLKIMRKRLNARLFFEAINYGFLNADYHNLFLSTKQQDQQIEVKNPLSDRYGLMRQSLVPGLLKNIIHNQRNQEASIKLFEVGTVFLGRREKGGRPEPELLCGSLDQDSFAEERQYLAGVMTGYDSGQAFDLAAKNIDFYHLKGVLEEIFSGLRLDVEYVHGSELSYLHPGESVTIKLKDNSLKVVGHAGKIHPDLAQKIDILGYVFVFELDVAALADFYTAVPSFKPFSRYPAISRDVALLVDEQVLIGDLIKLSHEVNRERGILSTVRVFDIYRGKNIEEGKKSVALSLTLQNADRTLTDHDAEEFISEFLRLSLKEMGARVR